MRQLRTRVVLGGVVALSLSGCGRQHGYVVRDGRQVVQLSSNEDVLHDLKGGAFSAGCRVDDEREAGGARSFHARCTIDTLEVVQRADELSYRCSELHGERCEALMLRLSPCANR